MKKNLIMKKNYIKRFKRLNNKTSDEDEFKKLEELDKRFKRLNNKKRLE